MVKIMEKVCWYANRLFLMSFSEVCFRILDEISKLIDSVWGHVPVVNPPKIEKVATWYFNVSKEEEIRHICDDNEYLNDDVLNNLLNHRFSYFAFDNTMFGENIDWHKDYKNNKSATGTG